MVEKSEIATWNIYNKKKLINLRTSVIMKEHKATPTTWFCGWAENEIAVAALNAWPNLQLSYYIKISYISFI